MRTRLRSTVTYLIAFLLPLFLLGGSTLAWTAPPGVSASVSGLGAGGDGTVLATMPFQFDVHIANETGLAIHGINNGFRVYSPDGAEWQPIQCDSFSIGWPTRFDLMPFNVTYYNVTGSGEDLVLVSTMRSNGPGLETGFDDDVWYINTEVSSDEVGKTICLDSTFFPPNTIWRWALEGGLQHVPAWGGPYCYLIEAPTWNPGDEHKMHFPQLPDENGWDCDMAHFGANIALADDWQCSETGWVKSIHWWGAWWQGRVGTLDTLYMAIFSDTVRFDVTQPEELLWMTAIADVQATLMPDQNPQNWFHSSAGYIYYYDDQAFYQFDVFLDEADWFWQEEGTIYWLVMSTDVDGIGDTALGWRSTNDHWRGPAIWGQLHSSGYWDFGAVASEPPDWQGPLGLAFVITDTVGSCCMSPLRGNVDYDVGDAIDISDLVYLVDYMFNGGPPPPCTQEADVDCSGGLDISDLVFTVDFMFTGGPAPCRCDCSDCP